MEKPSTTVGATPNASPPPASVSASASVGGFWRSVVASAGTRAFQQAAVFVAAMVIAGAILMWQLLAASSQLLSEQVIETLRVEADGLAALATLADAVKQPGRLVSEVSRRGQGGRERFYWLETEGGARLVGNLRRWPDGVPRPPADAAPGAIVGGTFSPGPDGVGGERLAVGVARALPGGYVVLIGRDLQAQRALADRVRLIYLAGFGALALSGLLAGYLMSRRALGRVEEIARTSDGITTGDFTRRVPLTGSGDELDHLAGNLNAMLDRIESLMAGLREVSDNIAHDLKTPLTRLRARAEAALRHGDGQEARDGLGRVIEDADEVIKTFNALLLIARLEAGALEASAETFDLAALVGDVAELYEPVAEEAEMPLTYDAPPALRVHANRQLLGQALANMLDNAIKYGRPASPAKPTSAKNGSIVVALAKDDGEIHISVADRGPGIPAADRERVLKRFVRLEASRTRPGTGLGLSLVTAVARLHGGRILLEDNTPGLRIVLVLNRKAIAQP